MPQMNPEIPVWARETAGLTPEEAVKKLGIRDARGMAAIDRLAALETGVDAPTRPMLRAVLRGDPLVPACEGPQIVRALPHGHVLAALGTARQIGLERLLPRGAGAPAS